MKLDFGVLIILGMVLFTHSFLHRLSNFQILKAFRLKMCENRNLQISTKTMPPKKFHPIPYSYHQEVTVEIIDITNEGLGVGRDNGWVIMVPLVIPGETAVVRVYKNNPNYSEADLICIVKESPRRVKPPCPYYQKCGGCQYQHIDIEFQRDWKKKQVENLLSRIGSLSSETYLVNEVIGSEHLYEYRSKITPHYDTPKEGKEVVIGFQQRGTRTLVDVEKCIIATPAINKKYNDYRHEILSQHLNSSNNINDNIRNNQKVAVKKGATLLLRECEEGIETDFRATITQIVEGITFKYRAGEFFQNNPYVLPKLVQHVIKLAQGNNIEYLIDTYCGSGLFSLTSHKSFKYIYGIEVSELAITAAKQNAILNNIQNVEFHCGKSEAIFQTVKSIPAEKTVIIIDPPRKGCDELFLSQLFQFSPKKLVYVSCDPATQARDTKQIVEAGYAIVHITPFDMFPQTRHIENVIAFERL